MRRDYWLLIIAVAICSGCRASDPAMVTPDPMFRFSTSVGLEFQFIPGGSFIMGGPEDDAQPRHEVTLRPFYVAREPIPKRLFRRFCIDVGRTGNREELGPDPAGWVFENEEQWRKLPAIFWRGSPTEDHSVRFQSLDDAQAFAVWLSRQEGRRFSVITEAQMEYILRANAAKGDEEYWWWSSQPGSPGNWGYDGEHPDAGPHIGWGMPRLYPANPFGVFLNSSRYWTSDRYAKYPSNSQVNPTGPSLTASGQYVVRRGPLWSRRSSNSNAFDASILLVTEVLPSDRAINESPTSSVAPPVEVVRLQSDQRLDLFSGHSLELRQIPEGSFTMGRHQRERPWTREWPETEMKLGSYWLGTTEVTQAQFQAVTGMNPSLVKGDSLPVHSVIMSEMLAFCDLVTARERAAGRLGADEEYRLPTEAEWEQAALAGRRSRFAHGDDEKQLADHAWFDVLGGPRPVATKRPNQWGFYDMEGNILEIMCEHMFQYPGTPQKQHWTPYLRGYGGQTGWYAARGGAWNMGAVACEPTLRRAVHADSRTYFMGFRLARGPALPEWTKESARSPWIFIFAPYRASKAYAAVMQSAPASWPRPAGWKPADKPEAQPPK